MFWEWGRVGAGLMLGISVVLIPVLLLLSAWGLRVKERDRAARAAMLSGPRAKVVDVKEVAEIMKELKKTVDELMRAGKDQPFGH